MSTVQFQDQRSTYTVKKPSGITAFVIKLGLAKDTRGAQMVLLVVAVIAVAIALFFSFGSGNSNLPSPEEEMLIQQG